MPQFLLNVCPICCHGSVYISSIIQIGLPIKLVRTRSAKLKACKKVPPFAPSLHPYECPMLGTSKKNLIAMGIQGLGGGEHQGVSQKRINRK